MPAVVRLATQIFGRLPLRKLPPDEAVAMGAAVQAALKVGDAAVDDLVTTDVAPFTLGISTGRRIAEQIVDGLFSPILERGTTIPCSRVKRFHTMTDDQTHIEIEVFQGEHALCRDNQLLGKLDVKRIPKKKAGQEPVEVRFTYDLNGILEVDVTVVSTGAAEAIVIEKSPGRLSRAQVDEARAAMKKLKFHPRDALPNTTALARADALFVELTGAPRDLLSRGMAVLNAAIESQRPEAIEQARVRLNQLIDDLRHERER